MYFITSVYPEKEGYGTRCVGYLSNKEKAIDAVINNACDIYEAGAYPYVVIEHIEEGFYQYDFEPLWFKYNEDTEKYEQIKEEPEFISDDLFGMKGHTVGFAIG
jgi:hypothetical protein